MLSARSENSYVLPVLLLFSHSGPHYNAEFLRNNYDAFSKNVSSWCLTFSCIHWWKLAMCPYLSLFHHWTCQTFLYPPPISPICVLRVHRLVGNQRWLHLFHHRYHYAIKIICGHAKWIRVRRLNGIHIFTFIMQLSFFLLQIRLSHSQICFHFCVVDRRSLLFLTIQIHLTASKVGHIQKVVFSSRGTILLWGSRVISSFVLQHDASKALKRL